MKILVINGPNLRMLGKRDATQYGTFTYDELCQDIKDKADSYGDTVEFFESSYEGAIIDKILDSKDDAILLNAGGYTHYSIAIRDAIDTTKVPVIEIHISDIMKREDFRHISVIKDVCAKSFIGLGKYSYLNAIDYLHDVKQEDEI